MESVISFTLLSRLFTLYAPYGMSLLNIRRHVGINEGPILSNIFKKLKFAIHNRIFLKLPFISVICKQVTLYILERMNNTS